MDRLTWKGNDPPCRHPLGISNVRHCAWIGTSMYGHQIVLGNMHLSNIGGRDRADIDVLLHVPTRH